MLCCDVWFSVVLVLFVASCEVLIDPDKALLLGPATIINPHSRFIYIGLFSLIETHLYLYNIYVVSFDVLHTERNALFNL